MIQQKQKLHDSVEKRPCLIVIVDDLITMIIHYHLRKKIKKKARLLQAYYYPCCTSHIQSCQFQGATTVSFTVLKHHGT